MRVKLTFTEDVLGTSSSNPDIHKEFIASKSADKKKAKEEMEALHTEELLEKSMTVFPRIDGKPFLWDYQVKGFLKDACSMLSRVKTTKSSNIRAYKKVIDGLVFVNPRKIIFTLNGEMGELQRPLRGQTAQGERITLAHSETVPAGSTVEFEILMLDESLEKTVIEWLEYGKLRGIGQWRNASFGRFTYKLQ